MNSHSSLTGSLWGNNSSSLRRALAPLSLATVLAVAASSQAHAQIFVSDDDANTIGEYNPGGTSNASFITDPESTPTSPLDGPQDMLLVNGDLFVANQQGTTVSEFDASTGATINGSLITGVSNPDPLLLATNGSNLYVGSEDGGVTEYSLSGVKNTSFSVSGSGSVMGLAVTGSSLLELNSLNGDINVYNAINGASVTPDFITVPGGQGAATGMTLVGNTLFVVSEGKVFAYDASTGVELSSNLIAGLDNPFAITSSNGELFITESTSVTNPFGTGFVGEYNLDGSPVNTSLISGLTSPFGIAVESVPEPSSWALGALACGAILFLRRRFAFASQS
jgi:hypothetical protein